MKLPVLSAKEIIKTLTKHGYYIKRQKGSHIQLVHPTKPPLTVPNHSEIAKGTLLAIIKASKLTIEDFIN